MLIAVILFKTRGQRGIVAPDPTPAVVIELTSNSNDLTDDLPPMYAHTSTPPAYDVNDAPAAASATTRISHYYANTLPARFPPRAVSDEKVEEACV